MSNVKYKIEIDYPVENCILEGNLSYDSKRVLYLVYKKEGLFSRWKYQDEFHTQQEAEYYVKTKLNILAEEEKFKKRANKFRKYIKKNFPKRVY